MKKFKLGVLAMALVSMLGFTSCLDGGEVSNDTHWIGFMKDIDFMGVRSFQTQFDQTLTALNSSALEKYSSPSGYAFVRCSADGDTEDPTQKSVDVTIQTYVPAEIGEIVSRAPMEGDGNASVSDINLSGYPFYGMASNIFFKLDDLFLPVTYSVRDIDMSDADEVSAEIASHRCSLYYNANEDFKNGSMTLHLRHRITDLSEDDKYSMYTNIGYYRFNLANVMDEYIQSQGARPNKIIVSYEQGTNGNYGGNSVTERQLEIDYKSVVDYYTDWQESQNGNTNAEG